MSAAFLLKIFPKIFGQLSADAGIAFKKTDHIVNSLNLCVFLFFKQNIHFLSHVIEIKCLGQNIVYVHRLFGLEFDPAFLIKIFQCRDNSLPVRLVTVQDGRNIGRGPYFPGMTMIHDRGHKIFALSFGQEYRPWSIFSGYDNDP